MNIKYKLWLLINILKERLTYSFTKFEYYKEIHVYVDMYGYFELVMKKNHYLMWNAFC